MSIFKKLFSTDADRQMSKRIPLNWVALKNSSQLDKIIEDSEKRTQAIFKHSTRCGISRRVLRKFEDAAADTGAMDFHFLDLLNYRALSNEIASKFQIIHQSPQLILIKNRQVVAHDSHYDLTKIDLKVF